MNNIWFSVISSIITGIVSSGLVVLYFEIREKQRHSLSHAHILKRFTGELFRILTIIRVAAKLKHPTSHNEIEVVKELETILGRYNPTVLMNQIGSLSSDQHRYIFDQLAHAQTSLSLLFSDSIAHKTVDGRVSASIAEMQGWVDTVLRHYSTFPEIIERKGDSSLQSFWMTSIFNLVENSFAILTNILAIQDTSEEILRWGSREK